MSQKKFKHNLAIVIATKDRPTQLEGALSSICAQSILPDQVVVVDGGDVTIESIVEQFTELKTCYMRVYPPALTKQKNAGITSVSDDIGLVGFIDDDIVFEAGALEAMMHFWDDAPEEIGGASFNLTDFINALSWLKSIPQRIFFIDNRDFGRVLKSGFNTPIWNAHENREVEWLGGGYTVWRKRVFDHWQFDEWYPGSGLWEDVHFSYRVGKHNQLVVVADARAAHAEPPISPKGQVQLGKTQIFNWLYFVRNNPGLSTPMCLWACIGRTVMNLTKGVAGVNLPFILRGLGNFVGLVKGALSATSLMRRKSTR